VNYPKKILRFNEFYKGDYIFCVNLGDSRAILSRKGKPVCLSVDHKPVNYKKNLFINENSLYQRTRFQKKKESKMQEAMFLVIESVDS